MSYEQQSAERYRAHAEELRTIAEADRLEQTRQMLLQVASHYEKMAMHIDALVVMDSLLPSRNAISVR